MNAVLSPMIFQDLIKSEDKEISKSRKFELFQLLVNDPEIKSDIQNWFDGMLAISELHVLKRLSAVEQVTGLNDFSDFSDENRKPTIPEQLSILAEKIDNTTKPIQESVIKPKSTLEQKATEFAIHIRDVATKKGKMFLDSKEIMQFLKCELPEPLRMKNICNPRQFKKDVIEKASEMFTFIVLDKKKVGRKDVRVVYNPENDTKRLNRTDSYRRSTTT